MAIATITTRIRGGADGVIEPQSSIVASMFIRSARASSMALHAHDDGTIGGSIYAPALGHFFIQGYEAEDKVRQIMLGAFPGKPKLEQAA